MKNIWQKLKEEEQPFFALAPLDDVTDTVFRRVVLKCAKPDVMFTEFTNADGFCSPGREAVSRKLKHEEIERPLIAQIWGVKPENYKTMAKALVKMGFDGVDLNFGCPIKDVIKKGACSGMMLDRALAAEVIAATKEGLNGKIPISVKTRIGFNSIETVDWIGFLLQQKLDALTVHGRTKKEMSKVPAHWDEIAKAVKLRDKISPETVIMGNGDVLSYEQGVELAQESGVDGIMIGRGIFHNPYIFEKKPKEHSKQELLEVLRFHLDLHEKTWFGVKKYEPLKKFIKIYVHGFEGASELRAEFMQTSEYSEARELIDKNLKTK